jgi:hypothetical protein
MMARSRRLAFMVALVVAFGTTGIARAAVVWTLTASPLTASTGTLTTFNLRASLILLGEIRCIAVGVPANFAVHGSGIVGSNAGDGWTSSVTGNAVRVWTTSGGDRLRTIGHYVQFTVRATPMSMGSLVWSANAYADEDCEGAGSVLGVPPVVVVTGPAVTPPPTPTTAPTIAPTMAPTPTPTPRPRQTPKPTPTPVAPASTPRPSVAAPEAPDPTAPDVPATAKPSSSPSELPTASASPTVTAGPTPTAEPSSGAAPSAPPPTDGPGSAAGLVIAEPATDGEGGVGPITLGALGLLGSVDSWIVPGMLFGVPGVLVVVFALLQGAGAAAWIPAIRRLGRGEERRAVTA